MLLALINYSTFHAISAISFAFYDAGSIIFLKDQAHDK